MVSKKDAPLAGASFFAILFLLTCNGSGRKSRSEVKGMAEQGQDEKREQEDFPVSDREIKAKKR